MVNINTLKSCFNRSLTEEEWNQFDSKDFNICLDSRKSNSNSLFIAVIGERLDAHQFLDSVYQNGTKLAIVQQGKDYSKIPKDFTLIEVKDTTLAFGKLATAHGLIANSTRIAITGSNGKTTTKGILFHLLSSFEATSSTQGNFNNHIGVPLSLLDIKPEHKFSIIEMGTNHPGEIQYLAELAKPAHAIITNIGDSHLEYLKDRKGVFIEKTSLLDLLEKGASVFIPQNDPFLLKLNTNTQYKVIRYGIEEGDFQATQVHKDSEGFSFKIKDIPFRLNILGEHNLLNSLAALAMANSLGFDLPQLSDSIKSYTPNDSRAELLKYNDATLISDCYNANPSSMKKAIDMLCEHNPNQRKVAVLGDMGELGKNEVQFHQEIGQHILSTEIDTLITQGTLAKEISNQLLDSSIKKFHANNQDELLDILRSQISPNDAILFKASNFMGFQKIITTLCKGVSL
jgi:UDP-N-acetylmuramoyl-tripeptide--D-alanyl-D-alanine ligase